MTKLDALYEAALREAARNETVAIVKESLKPKRHVSPGGRLSKKLLASHAVPPIKLDEATKRKMFGPVWHGSTEEGRDRIAKDGFKIIVGMPRSGDTEHGYPYEAYGRDISLPPPPIHHLGFGIYFTSSKTIAKSFNHDTMTGLVTYYLDVPRLATINFGAAGTMMKWWISQGYDGDLAKTGQAGWFEATKMLTKSLAERYDAVWFKGKGLKRLLDGDQICVYDTSRIYRLDTSNVSGFDIGAKIRRKSDGEIGKIVSKQFLEEHFRQYHGGSEHLFRVKWKSGGKMEWNVRQVDVEPVTP